MKRAWEYRIVECDGDGLAFVIVETSLNEPIVSEKAGRAWVRANGAPEVAYRVIALLTPELRVCLKERRVIEERKAD